LKIQAFISFPFGHVSYIYIARITYFVFLVFFFSSGDVESNSYASLIRSSPPTNETDSINDDHQFETEITEVYMSQGSLTNVSIVSDAMVPSVKQLREKFENAKFNN
jgi:hypothetical protein